MNEDFAPQEPIYFWALSGASSGGLARPVRADCCD